MMAPIMENSVRHSLSNAFGLGEFQFAFSRNTLGIKKPGCVIHTGLLFLLGYRIGISQGIHRTEEPVPCIVLYPNQRSITHDMSSFYKVSWLVAILKWLFLSVHISKTCRCAKYYCICEFKLITMQIGTWDMVFCASIAPILA